MPRIIRLCLLATSGLGFMLAITLGELAASSMPLLTLLVALPVAMICAFWFMVGVVGPSDEVRA